MSGINKVVSCLFFANAMLCANAQTYHCPGSGECHLYTSRDFGPQHFYIDQIHGKNFNLQCNPGNSKCIIHCGDNSCLGSNVKVRGCQSQHKPCGVQCEGSSSCGGSNANPRIPECQTGTCKNGGVESRFGQCCDCSRTNFKGSTCEIPLTTITTTTVTSTTTATTTTTTTTTASSTTTSATNTTTTTTTTISTTTTSVTATTTTTSATSTTTTVTPYVGQHCNNVMEAVACGTRIPLADCTEGGAHEIFAKTHCPTMCGIPCDPGSKLVGSAPNAAVSDAEGDGATDDVVVVASVASISGDGNGAPADSTASASGIEDDGAAHANVSVGEILIVVAVVLSTVLIVAVVTSKSKRSKESVAIGSAPLTFSSTTAADARDATQMAGFSNPTYEFVEGNAAAVIAGAVSNEDEDGYLAVNDGFG